LIMLALFLLPTGRDIEFIPLFNKSIINQ
jgi:hypothetical protein